MDYKIIDYYLDCPYKAFLALANKQHKNTLEHIFREASEKSIQHFFSDKDNFQGKVKINRSVYIFECHLKANGITGTTFDLLMRRFVLNLKLLKNNVDYTIKSSIPCVVLNINIPHVDTIQMIILGCHETVTGKSNRPMYKFFIYESCLKNEIIENSLRVRLLVHALKLDPSFNNDILFYSTITVLDFYNNDSKTCIINKVSDVTSIAHLESMLLSIKLGISYPAPKSYHCSSCQFANSCVYSICSKNSKKGLADNDSVTEKYKRIISSQF